MAALIHIDGRSYQLPAEPGPQALAAEIRAAVEAKGAITIQVEIADQQVTLYVNTAQVGVIALDWEGVGAGFFHG